MGSINQAVILAGSIQWGAREAALSQGQQTWAGPSFLCFYNGGEYELPLPYLLHKGVARPMSPLQYLRRKVVCCLVAQSCLTLCGPTRLLCPWTSPGKNTGVSCHALLRGIFLTQGLNLVSCIAGGFFTIEPPGKPQGDNINRSYSYY